MTASSPTPTPEVAGPVASDPVAALVMRSQSLESVLLSPASALEGGTSATERERLWGLRVAMLESLADEQRQRAAIGPAIW